MHLAGKDAHVLKTTKPPTQTLPTAEVWNKAPEHPAPAGKGAHISITTKHHTDTADKQRCGTPHLQKHALSRKGCTHFETTNKKKLHTNTADSGGVEQGTRTPCTSRERCTYFHNYRTPTQNQHHHCKRSTTAKVRFIYEDYPVPRYSFSEGTHNRPNGPWSAQGLAAKGHRQIS